MALIIADRVKETTITEGTGTITLSGPTFGGFQSFSSAIGEGNTTYYCIQNESNFEIGVGTYSSGTLSRDTVIESSNSGAKISITGVAVVFCVVPSTKLIYKNENGDFVITGDVNVDDVNADLVSANSGDFGSIFSNGIESSGLLTLIREDAGNFFHAYVDDSNDRTISLHSDAAVAPTWKLGLKNSPSSETDAPAYAYIYGSEGSIGLVGNSDNQITISNSSPFIAKHQGVDVITAHYVTGVHLQSNSSAYPALIVNGGAALSADIQRWNNNAGTTLSVVDNAGNFGIRNSNPSYHLDVTGTGNFSQSIRFGDGTVQSTAYVNSSGELQSQITTNAAVSGSLQPQITENSQVAIYASGHTLQSITDNGAVTDNEITINANFSAVSGSLSGIDFTPLSEANYPPHQEGRIFFDAESHTISMYSEEPEISLQVGQEQYLRIRNTNSYTLKNGSGVYLTGSQGTHPTVDYAIASGEDTSHVVGLATHDIEPNSFGYVTTYGIVRGVDTSAFSDGDELYLSAEHSGVLVNTSPIAPNYKSTIGHVIRSHHSNGTILVANEGVKLGGGDAKTLGNIGTSGIAFFESVTPDGNAGILASDANFYYDSGNDRLHIGAGGIRFNDGTTQTTAGGGGGGGNRTYNNITSDFSMTDDSDVVFLDTSSSMINVYLPTAIGQGGKELTIKLKSGSNSGVLVASGSQTVDGQAQFLLHHTYESVTLISDNSNWFIT